MKTSVLGILAIFLFITKGNSQLACSTAAYEQQIMLADPSLQQKRQAIEAFTSRQLEASSRSMQSRTEQSTIIRIPVVVHVLYHYPSENIDQERIANQLYILNRDFRRKNPDSINTPAGFKQFAADCEIEFHLATVDPAGRATKGVVRKYTPVTRWEMDDKIKFSAEMGDDAWDPSSYLNIWIGNIQGMMGFSTFPGAPVATDGIILNMTALGGRTLVHEAGHWLNLKHLWGDADCGDDHVGDTPKQRSWTPGCPSGTRITCDNAPLGDMYMNYMDFTSDACMNLFTKGQKARMRALFAPGGARHSILASKGLGTPLIDEIPLPTADPRWLHVRTYPNPASSEITINLEYDVRWIGKPITVLNMMGRIEKQDVISGKLHRLDISRLKPGVYFIRAQKGDEKILERFVKL